MTRTKPDIHSGQTLAPGEAVLWEGRPRALDVARRILHGNLLLAYFVLLMAFGAARALWTGAPLATAAWPILPGIAVAVVIALFARSIARSTTYLVTPRRIVLRFGAALPRHLSIPFSQVTSLALALHGRGCGDIALLTRDDVGVPSYKLWPHARGWRLRRPCPTLRCVPDAALVATRVTRLLSEAEQARHARAAAADAPPVDLRLAS